MKKKLLTAILTVTAMCASAQSYEVRTLTFEDADYKGTGNVVGGMDWSSLIDNPEYNGPLLYGDGASTYSWYDEGNTDLVWDGLQGMPYYSGGAAVSNYYETDLSKCDYQKQLSIPLEKSDNQFIVIFGSENTNGVQSYAHCSPFYFADGKARVIESIDVMNTGYVLNSLTNGDYFAPAATENTKFTVHFEGTREDGSKSEVTHLLADGRHFVTDWTNVDLTALGKVTQIRVYVTGSSDLEGQWGLNTPGYVALDNIKVRYEKVTIKMNAKTKYIKSLVNIATGEVVEVAQPESANTFNLYGLEAGSYLLTAFAADSTTVAGTIQLDVDADNTTFTILPVEVRLKNTDWTYGTDCTYDLKVNTKEGQNVNTTIGDYTNGNKIFMVFNGDTYYLDAVPSDARKREGYVTASYTGTVTANPTIQVEMPMAYAFNITVPMDAKAFIGTKTAHYVKFKEVTAESVISLGDYKIYTYKLADKQVYNYRITQNGKYTHAGVFTMSGDNTKVPLLNFKETDLEAKDPKFIDHDVAANDGYNVGDIFLNINEKGYLKLDKVGDTYDILPMRNWELIESLTGNYFIEPDYHFTVLNLNGRADNSVVKVENEMLTAVGEGTAIVLVSYDAMHVDLYKGAEKKTFVGGSDWGAIWPENTGCFVVTVGNDGADIKPNMIINKDYLTTVTAWGSTTPVDTKLSMENIDAEFDVLYYLDTEDGFDYTFTPEGVATVTLARPTIGENMASYNGFSDEGVTKNEDGSYTVHLTFGRNIVCLTDAEGKSVYQVITAKPCHRDITVNGEAVTVVKPGDAVTVQYSGLYHPANKLAGIHNFSAFLTYKQKNEGLTLKDGAKNQYKFASTPKAQAVTFTVPEDFTETELTLADGVVGISGFGDPVGNHRATSKVTGRAPNFTAISQNAVFGRVPGVTLTVDIPFKLAIATFEDLELEEESYWQGVYDEERDEYGIGMSMNTFQSGSFLFDNYYSPEYGGYWGNFGYSNQTDNSYESLADQFHAITGGGYNSATFGIAYPQGGKVTIMGTDEPVEVPGFYVTNASYAYTSMMKGDGYAKKFAQGDWFKLTITGYDADDEVTGTKEFYLADLRDEDSSNHYIIKDWHYVDLSGLGKVKSLTFSLSSTDNSPSWGMNTPGYFCFDDFGATGTETTPEGNMPTGISNVKDNTIQQSAVYGVSGIQQQMRHGLNIVRMSDGTVRKIMVK